MPTTRSGATQAPLATKQNLSSNCKVSVAKKAEQKASASKKRKRLENTTPSKNAKEQNLSASKDVTGLEKSIIINRAPVLQLWTAHVAKFLHPELAWETSLSVGSAVSSLCAISKGRSIGVLEPKKDTGAESEKKDTETTGKVTVMGFKLHVKSGAVILNGKAKRAAEHNLKKRFGDEEYNATSDVSQSSLTTWMGNADELDKKAFFLYERFQPNLSTGQRGRGRKGELDLDVVKNVVKR